jgi:hypothetical protein
MGIEGALCGSNHEHSASDSSLPGVAVFVIRDSCSAWIVGRLLILLQALTSQDLSRPVWTRMSGGVGRRAHSQG